MTGAVLPPPGTPVTIACCASRPSCIAVTRQLFRRLRQHRYLERFRFDLLLVHAAPHQLPLADLAAIAGVRAFLLVDSTGITSYARRRNLALTAALRRRARYLFFYDDDEHWVKPRRIRGDRLCWRPVDPLGPHLAGLAAGAAVTCGITLGQRSPIPASLPWHGDPLALRQLGHALRLGSEFLDGRSFVEDAGRLRLWPPPRRRGPLRRRRGILPLSGGNLALDLAAVHDGRIPPYYNPAGARGEDALLGARLAGLQVQRVDACSFHDPFGRLDCDDDGEPAPVSMARLQATDDLSRFAAALQGWIGYAPLLIRLGGGVRAGWRRERRLDELQRVVDAVSLSLAADLDRQELATLPDILHARRQRCAEDEEEMQRQTRVWRRSRSGCRAPDVTGAEAGCR